MNHKKLEKFTPTNAVLAAMKECGKWKSCIVIGIVSETNDKSILLSGGEKELAFFSTLLQSIAGDVLMKRIEI